MKNLSFHDSDPSMPVEFGLRWNRMNGVDRQSQIQIVHGFFVRIKFASFEIFANKHNVFFRWKNYYFKRNEKVFSFNVNFPNENYWFSEFFRVLYNDSTMYEMKYFHLNPSLEISRKLRFSKAEEAVAKSLDVLISTIICLLNSDITKWLVAHTPTVIGNEF